MNGGPAKRSRRESGGSGGARASRTDRANAAVLSVEAFAFRRSDGADRKAIENYRKRMEGKRVRTAQQLRSYHKLMKKEGYEPGKGASRKRPREADSDGATAMQVPSEFEHSRGDDGDASHGKKQCYEDGSSKSGSSNGKQTITGLQKAALVRNEEGADEWHGRAGTYRTSGSSELTPFQGRNDRARRWPHKSNPHAKSLHRAELRREAREAEQERRREQEQTRSRKLRERRQRSIQLGQRTKKGQPIMKNVVHDILRKLEKEQQQQQRQQP